MAPNKLGSGSGKRFRAEHFVITLLCSALLLAAFSALRASRPWKARLPAPDVKDGFAAVGHSASAASGAAAATRASGAHPLRESPLTQQQRSSCPGGLLARDAKNAVSPPPTERFLLPLELLRPVRPSVVPFSGNIPAVVVQTSKRVTVPQEMHRTMMDLRKLNADFEFRYFSETAARSFVKSNMPRRVLRFYDSLVPGEFKSDVFRYCYLYQNGGVYIDSDYVALAPLREMLFSTDQFVGAVTTNGQRVGLLDNSFIAVEPRSPLMLQAIEEGIMLASKTDIGRTPWALTGAGALTRAFLRVQQSPPQANREYSAARLIEMRTAPGCAASVVRSNSRDFFHTKYPAVFQESWYFGQPPHDELWRQRRIIDPSLAREADAFVDNAQLRPEENHARRECPFGLTEEVARSVVSPPPHHRLLMTPPTTHRATATNAGSVVSRHIPQTAFQITSLPEVPHGTLDAMMSLRRTNPDLTFSHFTLDTARQWLEAHADHNLIDEYDSLRSTTLKKRLFILVYLYHEGGIFLGATLSAGHVAISSAIAPLTQLIVSVSSEGSVLPHMIAARAGHPLIREALNSLSTAILMQNYGLSPQMLSIGYLIEQAWASTVDNPKSSLRGLVSSSSIRTSPLDARPLGVIHFKAAPLCHIGDLRAFGVGERMPVAHTGYQGMHIDATWYATENFEQMWAQRQLFTTRSAQFFTFKPGNDAELPKNAEEEAHEQQARRTCPFGQTQVLAYNPPVTPPERRLMLEMPRFTPAREEAGTGIAIPRKILQTGKRDAVPLGMFSAMHTIIKANPDFEHHYFSDDRAREYIKENMNLTVLDAFDSLIPGAYKSDLFRYIWLYQNGGVYVDADQIAVTPLALEQHDLFVSAEDPGANGHLVYNAFMAAVPRHPIIEDVLRETLELIFFRDYSTDPLAITGPVALARAFERIVGESPLPNRRYANHVRLCSYAVNPRCAIGDIRWTTRTMFHTRYPTYKQEMKWYLGQGHYWTMWRRRQVYGPRRIPLTRHPGSQETIAPEELEVLRLEWLASRLCPESVAKRAELLPQQLPSSSASSSQQANKFIMSRQRKEQVLVDVPSFVPAVGQDSDGQEIPRIIVQVAKHAAVPKGMWQCIASIRRAHPQYTHHFFSLETAREYIREQENHIILSAFDALVPFTLKRDLFHLFFLSMNGGVTIRNTACVTGEFRGLQISSTDEFIGLEQPGFLIKPDLMASVPGHPIVVHMLEKVLAVVGGRIRPATINGYTGYDILAEAFKEVVEKRPGPSEAFDDGVRLLTFREKHKMCLIGSFQWHDELWFASDYATSEDESDWYLAPEDNLSAAHTKGAVFANIKLTLRRQGITPRFARGKSNAPADAALGQQRPTAHYDE